MSESAEQIFLSDEILEVMRRAAEVAGNVNEPFITVRSMLLALLDDPQFGPALHGVLPREKLLAYQMDTETAKANIASRIAEPAMQTGERSRMLRFDTLAFKVPGGARSVWLSRQAFSAWNEGAKRVVGDRYMPKHLAFGIAAEAVRTPGMFAALDLSTGEINDAILTVE